MADINPASIPPSIEDELQSAIINLDYSGLVRIIKRAETMGYTGPWLRSAVYIQGKLREEKMDSNQDKGLEKEQIERIQQYHQQQEQEVSITMKENEGESNRDTSTTSKELIHSNEAVDSTSASQLPVTPSSSTLSAHQFDDSPDWWKYPPADLAPYLPSAELASLASTIDESIDTSNSRYNAIVSHTLHSPSSFPIAVIAFNRPALLHQTLTSLLSVRGITVEQVTIYQDGNMPEIAAVATNHTIRIVQNIQNQIDPEAEIFGQPAARIARHYKWTLTHIFNAFPAAPYAIIVEDDMLFSNDFLLYFSQLAHLYSDPSIYCITSWNDNGQSHLARDPRVLYRTSFFGGLGWLISRQLYKNEWEYKWPSMHWDHWLRDDAQRLGRECIYPEISRNYNIGKVGTHSDDAMYLEYFQYIFYNQQQSVWLGNVTRMIKDEFENNIIDTLTKHSVVINPTTSSTTGTTLTTTLDSYNHSNLVIIYAANNFLDVIWEEYIAVYFGLWHFYPFYSWCTQSDAYFQMENQ